MPMQFPPRRHVGRVALSPHFSAMCESSSFYFKLPLRCRTPRLSTKPCVRLFKNEAVNLIFDPLVAPDVSDPYREIKAMLNVDN